MKYMNNPKNLALPLSKIYWVITDNCNMKCDYCYEYSNNYIGLQNRVINIDTIKSACNFFINSPIFQYSNIANQIFGGEPTLYPEIVDYLITEVKNNLNKRHMNSSWGIQTNCFNISEKMIEIITKNKLNVEVSLDGPKVIQDEQRIDADGKGTYDKVIDNLKKLIKLRKENIIPTLSAEVTITNKTLTKMTAKKMLDFIRPFHFDMISFIPVSFPKNHPSSLSIDKYQIFENEKTDTVLASLLTDSPIFELKQMSAIQHVIKTNTVNCNAGRGLYVISSNGDVYPCPQLLGISNFNSGNVNHLDYDKIYKMAQYFESAENKRNFTLPCSKCEIMSNCNYGCFGDNYVRNGDIFLFSDKNCIIRKNTIAKTRKFLETVMIDNMKKEALINSLKLYKKIYIQGI